MVKETDLSTRRVESFSSGGCSGGESDDILRIEDIEKQSAHNRRSWDLVELKIWGEVADQPPASFRVLGAKHSFFV